MLMLCKTSILALMADSCKVAFIYLYAAFALFSASFIGLRLCLFVLIFVLCF